MSSLLDTMIPVFSNGSDRQGAPERIGVWESQ